MYALVNYTSDNSRCVVPIRFIRNFQPLSLHDFDNKQVYHVFWTPVEEIKEISAFETFIKKASFEKSLLRPVDLKKSKKKIGGEEGFYCATILEMRGNFYNFVEQYLVTCLYRCNYYYMYYITINAV